MRWQKVGRISFETCLREQVQLRPARHEPKVDAVFLIGAGGFATRLHGQGAVTRMEHAGAKQSVGDNVNGLSMAAYRSVFKGPQGASQFPPNAAINRPPSFQMYYSV